MRKRKVLIHIGDNSNFSAGYATELNRKFDLNAELVFSAGRFRELLQEEGDDYSGFVSTNNSMVEDFEKKVEAPFFHIDDENDLQSVLEELDF